MKGISYTPNEKEKAALARTDLWGFLNEIDKRIRTWDILAYPDKPTKFELLCYQVAEGRLSQIREQGELYYEPSDWISFLLKKTWDISETAKEIPVGKEKLKRELIQLATVIFAWLEQVDCDTK